MLALFLALVVLAFYLGAHGPRDAPAAPAQQPSGVINREINGLEFIRKSLEYSFTGLGALSGSGTARPRAHTHSEPGKGVDFFERLLSSDARKPDFVDGFASARLRSVLLLLSATAGEGSRSVWHVASPGDCKQDAIPTCHAGCNPVVHSTSAHQVRVLVLVRTSIHVLSCFPPADETGRASERGTW
jgi:hypothetical protein